MRKNDPIKHITSDHVLTVQQGQPISEVFKLLHENEIHHVPVLDEKKLVGIVSSTDLVRLNMGVQAFDSESLWSFLDSQHELIDVMTSNPKTLHDSDTVRDAAQALSNGKYHSMPVLDNNSEIVGIVTTTDLIQYLCEQY